MYVVRENRAGLIIQCSSAYVPGAPAASRHTIAHRSSPLTWINPRCLAPCEESPVNDRDRIGRFGARAQLSVEPGKAAPLGSTLSPEGVNFSIYSKSCTHMELLLFDRTDDAGPSAVVALDAARHRTYHYWHAFVPGLRAGQIYGYRAHGPLDPKRGLRFDAAKVLFDPYGKAMAVPQGYSRRAASGPGDDCAIAIKSVVADPQAYDWEGDVPLQRPFFHTVIYELHVGGFTRHPSSGLPAQTRGTYRGLIDKIPYLQDLGITAVELLPVFQFDAQDAPPGLANYWGYSSLSFFAPHAAYSSRPGPFGPLDEFRDMVKALHRAGIEVILDVAFNHTAEGDHLGPTLCYRGLENAAYYILQDDPSRYADYSGTGNTLNGNQPIVRRLIVDSLRYWVECMHVDGFRFDLASILSRDEKGRPLENPPVLWDIESDPVLAGTKLIAEAWDAAGLYQLGSFVGDSWKEWNGRFRDDVRSFMKGDPATARRLARRLLGSPDLYSHEEREPEQSINFVTCHDGFTLNDLVSYDRKHNEANGEGNRDGNDFNLSWNCGVEGPSDDIARRAPAQPPGEELHRAHAARRRHAAASHGRRSPAHAARQQQCLLPGQRIELVRLERPREARRRAPLHAPDARAAVAALGLHMAGEEPHAERAAQGGADRLARDQALQPGLARRVPQPRADGADARRQSAHPRHRQRVLGGARLRAAARRGRASGLATRHRYVSRVAP